MIKNGEPYVSLIPIILISSKRTTYSFRVDNNIIGDFFRDTESINNGKYGKEKSVYLDRRFLEQKEFLEYFYPDSKSSLSPELWLYIYQEKIQNGKGGLLHSEYLQLKSTNLN